MRTLLQLAILCGSMTAVPAPTAPTDDAMAVPENRGPLFYYFRADDDGVIRLFVERVPKGVDRMAAVVKAQDPYPFRVRVPLKDLVDLKITTAGGRKLDVAELQRLHPKGGCFIGSSDGKPISPAYRRMFRAETIFLESPELTLPYLHNHWVTTKVGKTRIIGNPGKLGEPPAASKNDEPAYPTGQPPATMFLNPDDDGKIRLVVDYFMLTPDPRGAPRVIYTSACVPMKSVKSLKIVQIDGKNVTIEEAERRLSKGGSVLVFGDSEEISPGYRRLLRDDAMVFRTWDLYWIGRDVAGQKLRDQGVGRID